MLFKYRANTKAIPAGMKAPNIEFSTLDGKDFNLHQFNMPVMLVFLNTKTFMSSAIYPQLLMRRIPRLKLLDKRGYASLIVILDTKQTPEKIKKIIGSKKYKILENYVFLSNIELASEMYGLSSWPHFFLVDSGHNVIYESKVPNMEMIDTILQRSSNAGFFQRSRHSG
jgi:hypothetical protein